MTDDQKADEGMAAKKQRRTERKIQLKAMTPEERRAVKHRRKVKRAEREKSKP